MTLLGSILCGLGLGAALVLAAAASTLASPARETESKPVHAGRWKRWGSSRLLRVGTIGVVAGTAVWWATGWPVAGLAVATGTVGVPRLLAPARPRQAIALSEALASWTRRMADLLASGTGGLEHAIVRSAATAPEPLTEPVRRLAERIRTDGVEPALRRFADELADPAVDEVVLALLLRVRAGGRGLAGILHAQATALGSEITARREVEADRAKPRTTVRSLVGITVVMIAGLVCFARDYLAPFDTLTGQAVLTVAAGIVAGALVWMHRLSVATRTTRYLTTGGRHP